MTLAIDTSTEYGQRVQRHLENDPVIWLTTVDASGLPQPRPVWFLWDGTEFLIYSRPDAYKVAHIRANPRVALNFDAGPDGEDIVVFVGEARLAPDEARAQHNTVYVEKYRDGIAGLDMTPQAMGDEYNTAIRVRPDRLRGW